MFMMMIHLNYIHIIHVRYSIFLCCTNFVYSFSLQVLTNGGRGSRVLRASFLGHAGRGAIIPPQHLRRVLVDSMQTLADASSSARRGRGKTKRDAARGVRGGWRGRKAAAPSSPPPPADSGPSECSVLGGPI